MLHNRMIKGGLIFSIGLILFLHSMGIIEQSLGTIITIGSIVLMFYGFIELDGQNLLKKIFGKLGIK